MSEHRDRAVTALEERRVVLAQRLAQLRRDVEFWNETHPDEKPITVDLNLTADVEAAKQSGKKGKRGG